VEEFLPIECEIPSSMTIVEVLLDITELDACLIPMEHLDEKLHDASTTK